MKKKIKYNTMRDNTKLVDFEGTKEIVLKNYIKAIPGSRKKKDNLKQNIIGGYNGKKDL